MHWDSPGVFVLARGYDAATSQRFQNRIVVERIGLLAFYGLEISEIVRDLIPRRIDEQRRGELENWFEQSRPFREPHPDLLGLAEGKNLIFLQVESLQSFCLDLEIEAGPLDVETALSIAIQAGIGLQVAHEAGVVHRDIKSANLMVTKQGYVKVTDFGLALVADWSRRTQRDQTPGTPAYMSPEQAIGESVDRRADIWALGVVLYEMVTGRLPFDGEYQQAVLYAVINEQPKPMTALRVDVPVELDRIVGKALEKDPGDRYQHMEELLVDLRRLLRGHGSDSLVAEGDARATAIPARLSAALSAAKRAGRPRLPQRSVRNPWILQAGLVAASVVALVFATLYFRQETPNAPLRRFILPTEGTPIQSSISPDGRHVVYVTQPGTNDAVVWVQDLEQERPEAVFGPAALPYNVNPAWSPDGEFLVFASNGGLQKVSVRGGPALTVSGVNPRPNSGGGLAGDLSSVWMPDGRAIVFGQGGKLYKVPSGGGTPEPWLETELGDKRVRQVAFFGPEYGDDKLLYVEGAHGLEREIFAFDRLSGRHVKVASGAGPAYALSGHVLYSNINPPSIWAVPFSVETMTVSGDPFPVVENGGRPSLALDGTLSYLEVPAGQEQQQLVLRNRRGNLLGTIGLPQDRILNPKLSPDEKRVAVGAFENGNQDIWVHEVDRPVKNRVTTHEKNDLWPVWSSTGEKIAFTSGRDGGRDLYVKNADGTGEAKPLLLTPDSGEWVTQWSHHEDILFYIRQVRGESMDIFYLKPDADGSGYEEVAFAQTPAHEELSQLSPDGRFLAYVSTESGNPEIYIESFPQGGGKRAVSVNGGLGPRWRGDGKELFYKVVNPDTLMSVRVSTSPSLTLTQPQEVFSSPGFRGRMNYDVTADGERFVLIEKVGADIKAEPMIRIVQNWYEEFREREQD